MSCPDGPEGQLQAGGLPWAPRTTNRACEDDCPSADGPTGRPLCADANKGKGYNQGEQGGPAPLGKRGGEASQPCHGNGLLRQRVGMASGIEGRWAQAWLWVSWGAGGLWLDARLSGVDLTFGIRSHSGVLGRGEGPPDSWRSVKGPRLRWWHGVGGWGLVKGCTQWPTPEPALPLLRKWPWRDRRARVLTSRPQRSAHTCQPGQPADPLSL